MKFVRFDAGTTGLVIEHSSGPQIVDIVQSLAGYRRREARDADLLQTLFPGDGAGSWLPMIRRYDEARGALQGLVAWASGGGAGVSSKPLGSVRLRAPLVDPAARIFALGGNFAVHMQQGMKAVTGKLADLADIRSEKSRGLPPWGFIVLPDTVADPGSDVGPPRDAEKFDYEAEVAIVLLTGGKDIKPGDLRIWGYTAWNDLSIRDPRLGIGPAMDRGGFTFGLEKNFDGANPCGPWLVVDEDFDVNNLKCRMRVNGETRQDFTTREMLWSFADTAEHISHYVTLKPGDIILSGTGPGTAIEAGRDGDRWLKSGDRLEVDIEGVGVLANTVRNWSG
jgi:acylpyruvate hydrolase